MDLDHQTADLAADSGLDATDAHEDVSDQVLLASAIDRSLRQIELGDHVDADDVLAEL